MSRSILRSVVLLLLIFVLQYIQCETQSIENPKIKKKIEDFINNVYLPESKVAGFGITVVQNNGEIVYSTGFGYADRESGIPNGNQTQFLIGSVTKSLTAAVVVKTLHEKFPKLGEKVLDTPVRKLLPESNFTLIDRFRSNFVTLRDMLSHNVCLETDDFTLLSESFNEPSEVAFRQRYAKEFCGFRTEFKYNNQMYLLVGEIIGQIAGIPFEELVKNFLSEAQMLNSALTKKDDDFSKMPFRAKPYYVKDNVTYPINTDLISRVVFYNAAGGLFATPLDMAKYMTIFLNSGKVGDKQVIPEEAMKCFTKPSIHVPSQPFKTKEDDTVIANYAYSLGLLISSYDGWQYLNHNGYFPPYNSQLSLYPALKLGIFSSSQSSTEVSMLVLHMFITETLKGSDNAMEKAMKVLEQHKALRKIVTSQRRVASQNFIEKNGNKEISNSVAETIGNYGSATGGDLEVSERLNEAKNKTELYFSYGKWAKGWLLPVGKTAYRIVWDSDIVQDWYAAGDSGTESFVSISNETFTFLQPQNDTMVHLASFQKGFDIKQLPIIPWNVDSCGPEAKSEL